MLNRDIFDPFFNAAIAFVLLDRLNRLAFRAVVNQFDRPLLSLSRRLDNFLSDDFGVGLPRIAGEQFRLDLELDRRVSPQQLPKPLRELRVAAFLGVVGTHSSRPNFVSMTSSHCPLLRGAVSCGIGCK